MKQSERTVYTCDFCKKNYLMKHAAVRHEKYCGSNPANWSPCYSCCHLDATFDKETRYREFNCIKLDKQLHSFKAEKIGHSCLGHTERMPTKCDSYKDKAVFNGIDF